MTKTIQLTLTDNQYSEMIAKLANELELYGDNASDWLKESFNELAKHSPNFDFTPTTLVMKYSSEYANEFH